MYKIYFISSWYVHVLLAESYGERGMYSDQIIVLVNF